MIALIFDTETTDLIDNHTLPLNRQPEIVEYYGEVVDLENGDVISELELRIKPKGELKEESIKKHGLTAEMLKDEPYFEMVAEKIQDQFLIGAKPIAHNASFDIEMLQLEFERLGKEFILPKRPLCSVEATVHLKGYRMTLTGLHEHLFGKGFPEAHRAKNDVQALTRCCVELFKRGEI